MATALPAPVPGSLDQEPIAAGSSTTEGANPCLTTSQRRDLHGNRKANRSFGVRPRKIDQLANSAEYQNVVCDLASEIDQVSFPEANPRVMKAERTFWEKATAMHVYCLRGEFRGGDAMHVIGMISIALIKSR